MKLFKKRVDRMTVIREEHELRVIKILQDITQENDELKDRLAELENIAMHIIKDADRVQGWYEIDAESIDKLIRFMGGGMKACVNCGETIGPDEFSSIGRCEDCLREGM